MTAWQKYQAWMQKSREPALFSPVARFWLGMAFMTTCMHLGTNMQNLLGDISLIFLVPVILVSTVVGMALSPVIFQRFVGEMHLGQGLWNLNLASVTRIAVMGGIYGVIAFRVREPFDLYTLIKLPVAMLICGFLFEITFGQISFFQPTQANKTSTLESQA